MSHAISPYDRDTGSVENRFSWIVGFSVILHIIFFWIFFFVLPELMAKKRTFIDNAITVELIGAIDPPAPAAPEAPVDPDLKGPDVVEIQPDAPPPPPQPPIVIPDPVAPPTPVIPLGPKAPEKPEELKRPLDPPPPPKPPKIIKDPPPKKVSTIDTDVEKLMKETARKVEIEKQEQKIIANIANIAKKKGQGEGVKPTDAGGTEGTRTHPDEERYNRQLTDIVTNNWVAPPGYDENSGLVATYEVTVDPDGHISSNTLWSSSGDTNYDLSVQRAINKSSPLPKLPPIYGGRPMIRKLKFNMQEIIRFQQR